MNQANVRYCDIKMLVTSLLSITPPAKLKKKLTKPPTVSRLTGEARREYAVPTSQHCRLRSEPRNEGITAWVTGVRCSYNVRSFADNR